jgi:hypothetical protein
MTSPGAGGVTTHVTGKAFCKTIGSGKSGAGADWAASASAVGGVSTGVSGGFVAEPSKSFVVSVIGGFSIP